MFGCSYFVRALKKISFVAWCGAAASTLKKAKYKTPHLKKIAVRYIKDSNKAQGNTLHNNTKKKKAEGPKPSLKIGS